MKKYIKPKIDSKEIIFARFYSNSLFNNELLSCSCGSAFPSSCGTCGAFCAAYGCSSTGGPGG